MNFPSIFSSVGEIATEDHETSHEGHGGHDKSSDVIFFIFSSLCLGGIVKEINKKTAVYFDFFYFFSMLFI